MMSDETTGFTTLAAHMAKANEDSSADNQEKNGEDHDEYMKKIDREKKEEELKWLRQRKRHEKEEHDRKGRSENIKSGLAVAGTLLAIAGFVYKVKKGD